ncbi:MAG: hypothetical protein KIT79_09815 [Deltaproteobacteria bacterium]|nr:hypothetical protein [Deltaproteobacteria bacterium]
MRRLNMRLLAGTGLALVLALVAIHTWSAARLPLASYDGRVIWAFKAHVLFERGTHADELHNPDFLIPHADYPALLPLLAVEAATLLGYWSPSILAWICICAFAATLYVLWWHARQSPVSLLVVAAWGLTPAYHLIHESCIRSGTADILVGFLVLVSAVCSVRAETGQLRLLYLAAGSATLGLAAATKFDGLMWAIAFIPIGMTLGGSDREWLSRGMQTTAGCGIFAVAVAAPWLRMTMEWSAEATEPYFYRLVTGAGLFDIGRWLTHAGQMLAELLLRPDRASIPIWITILAAGFAWRRGQLDRMNRAIMATTGLFLLCLLGAFQVSPWPTGEQVPVTLYRLMSQIAPVMALVSVRAVLAMEQPVPAKGNAPVTA